MLTAGRSVLGSSPAPLLPATAEANMLLAKSGGGRDSTTNGATVMPAHLGSVVSTPLEKLGSALFFASTSFSIIFVNKALLASTAHGFFGFPSFFAVAACQFLFTSLVLYTLKLAGRVQITDPSLDVLKVMGPLASIGLINVLCGLGGTQKISLPMFTVLRRFSIPMTMGLEWLLLGVVASKQVQFSVFLMVAGAVLAGMADLSFNLVGYLFILFNNVCTALNGVVMKRTLTASPNISRMAVLYYNSLFGAVFMTCLLLCRPEEMQAVRDFPSWKDPSFVLTFFLAAVMGSLLNYATFLCTHHNSALTTTVVGCLKNLATTYFSMLFLSDYVFSFNNFLGVTISVVGSLVYSYIELGKIRGGKSTKNDDSSSKDGEGNEKPAGKVSGAGNRHRPQGKR